MNKYPRTPHLPWSPGLTKDDRRLETLAYLQAAQEIVVTEKLDGENTTLHRDYLHARSLTYADHPSRRWVRDLWENQIAWIAPDTLEICGENVYAQHSIAYTELPTYFLVFGIREANSGWLAWDDVVEWCNLLGLQTAPILYRGPWDEQAVRACYSGASRYGGDQEGYVVRRADLISVDQFHRITQRGHRDLSRWGS